MKSCPQDDILAAAWYLLRRLYNHDMTSLENREELLLMLIQLEEYNEDDYDILLQPQYRNYINQGNELYALDVEKIHSLSYGYIILCELLELPRY